MITIKKVNAFEKSVIQYKKDHPIRFYIILFLGLFKLSAITNCFSLVLYNSNGVGEYIVGDFYCGYEICMDTSSVLLCLNIDQILKFSLLALLSILLYIKIKDLLVYRNENL